MSPSQASETCASASSATSANRKIIATQMLGVKRPGYASAQESSLSPPSPVAPSPVGRGAGLRVEREGRTIYFPVYRADLYNRTKWNIFLFSLSQWERAL